MSISLVEQPPYTSLFYALVIGWTALNARLHFRNRNGSVRRESSGSRRVLGLATGVGIVGAVVAYERATWAAIPAPAVAFWAAVTLLVIGAVLREYAIRTLGRYFTLDLGASDDQTIVDAGPYAWVRHPSYTGAATSLVGVGLALSNWLSLASVLAFVAIGYGYRIRVEERLLRAELDGAYERYAERTSYRLVPGIW